jgi:hypothetical protein
VIRRAILILLLLLAGCTAGAQRAEPQAGMFALLGDVPYTQPHANILDAMIDRINREKPAFVVHVGDITGGQGPCTDAWLEARAKQFARFETPFVLVPGDNEWTDCHRTGFDPLERLAKIRSLFHSRPLALPGFARQSAAYPEHSRWIFGKAVFVTLNVPGSNNNLGRTPAMDQESAARMDAVLAWLDEGVRAAAAPGIGKLVVFMHADPDFAETHNRKQPDGYARLLDAFRRHAAALKKPLVVGHGDTHRFRHDRPLEGVPNFVRIEVDGWPWLGWLKVGVATDPAEPISVERILNQ